MTLFIVSQLVASLLAGLLFAALGSAPAAKFFDDKVVLQFTFAFLVYGGMLAALWQFLRWRGISGRELGLRRPRLSDAGWALLALVVYVGIFAFIQGVLPFVLPDLNLEQRQDTGFGDAAGAGFVPLALTFVALVIVAPVAEETLMRGFFFSALRRKLPFVLTTLIVSAVFATMHLAGGEQGSGPLWIAAIDTFILSLVLCYLREKTGRLWASIGLHMLKNGIAFVALFILGAA
jgi:uncharacterized protein